MTVKVMVCFGMLLSSISLDLSSKPFMSGWGVLWKVFGGGAYSRIGGLFGLLLSDCE